MAPRFVAPRFVAPRTALVLPALLAVLLSACGSKAPSIEVPSIDLPQPPPPTLLELDISASARLNQSPDGIAAPLLVRVYELSDSGRFLGSSFFPLYEDDSATLSADLIARDELRLGPGDTRTLRKTLNPATAMIGVLAAYRSTEGRRWREVLAVAPEVTNAMRLELGPRELKLTPAEPMPDLSGARRPRADTPLDAAADRVSGASGRIPMQCPPTFIHSTPDVPRRRCADVRG